jgi:hypothetical protein
LRKHLEALIRAREAAIRESKRLIAFWRERLRRRPPPAYFSMFDSVDVGQIPPRPSAVAGYVGGNWPNFGTLVKRFPHAKHLSIAVNAAEDAMCLDVENGDATPEDAPAWVRRQHARGIKRPVLYASSSVVPEVNAALTRDGVTRDQYRVWSAHYTYRAHVEPGSDATQWTDKAFGRNLDQSLCRGDFL